MISLILALGMSGQAILYPTGRVMPGDPCAACPDPDSFTCQMWPATCYQCWEDCGSPIATPTVTPTPTNTPPPPTPTPHGPTCELRLPGSGLVYLTAYYKHESSTQGTRYTFETTSKELRPGEVARPCPCEGTPVGFTWSFTTTGKPFMECGDTGWKHWHIFSDGFESGDLEAWDG